MNRRVLKNGLKAGYLERGQIYPTEADTPQGGIISPTLANFALNGLEEHIAANFKPEKGLTSKGKLRKKATKLNGVRYADDFIVTGQSPQQLERVKVSINEFLKPRGLKISEAKTRLCNITSGFDLLGWAFRIFKWNVFMYHL